MRGVVLAVLFLLIISMALARTVAKKKPAAKATDDSVSMPTNICSSIKMQHTENYKFKPQVLDALYLSDNTNTAIIERYCIETGCDPLKEVQLFEPLLVLQRFSSRLKTVFEAMLRYRHS